VDQIWTALGHIISDLDRWQIEGPVQQAALDFKSKVLVFLKLLVQRPGIWKSDKEQAPPSSELSSPAPRQSPAEATCPPQTGQQRQKQLSQMTTHALRQVAVSAGLGPAAAHMNRDYSSTKVIPSK
jgi:hypothetical protein